MGFQRSNLPHQATSVLMSSSSDFFVQIYCLKRQIRKYRTFLHRQFAASHADSDRVTKESVTICDLVTKKSKSYTPDLRKAAMLVTSAHAFKMFAFPARKPREGFKTAVSRTILRNTAISAIASCKVKHASTSRWRSSSEHRAHLQALEHTFLALRVDYSELNLRRLKANGSKK